VPGVQELRLPYELCAADIDEAEPLSTMLLVTYLFTALPQLLPRATLDFSCKLGDQQVCRCSITICILEADVGWFSMPMSLQRHVNF
jgi:hypothetical protein